VVDGERATGTPNTIYDLTSVLFHSLEGGASYDTYIEDAEREEDEELTEFFRRVREEDRDCAAEARLLLAERTSNAARAEEGVAGVSAEDLTSPAEDATSPRPEPSLDFPGTEPVREDDSTARTGEVPPPEEVPPERAGEIPTAEEVPPPRTEELLGGQEVPSGTPPQAPLGDVQRESPSEALSRTKESFGEQERKIEQERDDKGLVDKAREALLGEEERGREGTGREDRR
jgi:hypothetical protein